MIYKNGIAQLIIFEKKLTYIKEDYIWARINIKKNVEFYNTTHIIEKHKRSL